MTEFGNMLWKSEYLQLPLGPSSLKNFQADPLEECAHTGCDNKSVRQYKLVGGDTKVIGLCKYCVSVIARRVSAGVLLAEIDQNEAIVYRIMTT
jgi:hypothetical protein